MERRPDIGNNLLTFLTERGPQEKSDFRGVHIMNMGKLT